VCHRCDNPPCCNPGHLWVGTQAENMADMSEKGRAARGEASPRSKLTEAQAIEIIAARGAVSQADLAARFGVSQAAVSLIWTGRRWSHLPRGDTAPMGRKLSEEDAREIIRLRGKVTQAALARRYGVCVANVSHIQTGRTWAYLPRETP
jgi:DNA-binding transcriptional regulator YiaG